MTHTLALAIAVGVDVLAGIAVVDFVFGRIGRRPPPSL